MQRCGRPGRLGHIVIIVDDRRWSPVFMQDTILLETARHGSFGKASRLCRLDLMISGTAEQSASSDNRRGYIRQVPPIDLLRYLAVSDITVQ